MSPFPFWTEAPCGPTAPLESKRGAGVQGASLWLRASKRPSIHPSIHPRGHSACLPCEAHNGADAADCWMPACSPLKRNLQLFSGQVSRGNRQAFCWVTASGKCGLPADSVLTEPSREGGRGGPWRTCERRALCHRAPSTCNFSASGGQ